MRACAVTWPVIRCSDFQVAKCALVTHVAGGGRNQQLLHLPAVYTEGMQLVPGGDVPETDGEVHAPRHQVVGVVPRGLVIRVQQAVHTTSVTVEDLTGQRV